MSLKLQTHSRELDLVPGFNLEEGYQSRLSGINDAIRSFGGIIKVEIMNGAREVHVES